MKLRLSRIGGTRPGNGFPKNFVLVQKQSSVSRNDH